ncbi:MAG TPA: acyl-CoA dehydrogenase family protein [Xanthomonadaceae bacterium]|nr:acyl-CoA dehydrogenase family protein [Luteimonas sp.]HRQ64187.1 acyl-CoA dehydrogenase family protein [Xanthomonadaceae bacterium]
MSAPLIMPDLIGRFSAAADAASGLVAALREIVVARTSVDGRIDRALADEQQHLVHGLGWYAAYADVIGQVAQWAQQLESAGQLREIDALLAQLLVGEYLAQLRGGIAMSQGETIRLSDFGTVAAASALDAAELGELRAAGTSQAVKSRIAQLLAAAQGEPILERSGLDDALESIRSQFHAFGEKKITPFAHGWHLRDELIPLELVQELGEMGVFGLTIPEAYGGHGMGKIAMCVVSEELSRAWIGVGSLATRSEIAAELILCGGTDEQKAHWLPRIADASVLPTAVFTEPGTGSDLGALRARALVQGEDYAVTGAKTWITHAARADLMTLLVRTDPDSSDYRGLSMLLAPKPRGDEVDPFPAPGMGGGEIRVIGYRGMKEYEIGFDGFRVPRSHLLGGDEGQGFKQLMATFESARIQTAARAIGVAQASLEVGLSYALGRRQFGRAIFEFPRVSNKLVMIAAELLGVRQLTYQAARQKDAGRRCDLEAGMAKLLAARVAWAAADNALQIHGGNGFAEEYVVSRLLADARILNIFEGAGEIQAQVIARRLLDGNGG